MLRFAIRTLTQNRARLGLSVGGTALAAACGGDSSDDTGGHNMSDTNGIDGMTTMVATPDATVEVTAEAIHFLPDRIEIPAGKDVKIRLLNVDPTEHDLQVEGLTVEVVGGTEMAGDHMDSMNGMLALHTVAGGSAEVVVRTEQRGTFAFYCTITGHKDAGMVGTFVVT